MPTIWLPWVLPYTTQPMLGQTRQVAYRGVLNERHRFVCIYETRNGQNQTWYSYSKETVQESQQAADNGLLAQGYILLNDWDQVKRIKLLI